jgi:septum formation protein
MVLASASPRRRHLAALMGLSFDVSVSNVEEDPCFGEHPQDMALRLSMSKAGAVAGSREQGGLIVAADTLVVLGQDILGKPTTEGEAFDMLVRLRNRQHLVYSGLALIDMVGGREQQALAKTRVLMRDYTDAEIRSYVASGDPMDKAGAYAIQHPGFEPVARIDGCFANVMGLPMCHLYRALRNWGFVAPIHPLYACPLATTSGCCWSRDIVAPPGPDDHSQHG